MKTKIVFSMFFCLILAAPLISAEHIDLDIDCHHCRVDEEVEFMADVTSDSADLMTADAWIELLLPSGTIEILEFDDKYCRDDFDKFECYYDEIEFYLEEEGTYIATLRVLGGEIDITFSDDFEVLEQGINLNDATTNKLRSGKKAIVYVTIENKANKTLNEVTVSARIRELGFRVSERDIILAPYETRTIALKGKLPKNIPTDTYRLMVRMESDDFRRECEDKLYKNVYIEGIKPKPLDLLYVDAWKSPAPGEDLDLRTYVKNNMGEDLDVFVEIYVPKLNLYGMDDLNIEAGWADDIDVDVDIPIGTKPKNYEFIATVMDESGKIYDQYVGRFTVVAPEEDD